MHADGAADWRIGWRVAGLACCALYVNTRARDVCVTQFDMHGVRLPEYRVEPPAFDFRNPPYARIKRERLERLRKLRASANPAESFASLRRYYRNNIAQFVDDWGTTLDTRNAGTALPVAMPFKLFPRQRDWIDWTFENWQLGEFGITAKSRDVGISWLAMAFSCSVCLLYDRLDVGFGSQIESKVDFAGDPGCLFYKGRQFVAGLPAEFRPGWDIKKHAPFMRIFFPNTGSSIVGDSGDGIGRGNRTAIFFLDEACWLERPIVVDAALSATTNCRQDVSSIRGMSGPFAEKYHSGQYRTFDFHWRDDPRKDDEWYAKLHRRYDPITIGSEYDINWQSSVAGVVIESAWINAAVDAHKKLGITPTGMKRAGLDIADEGIDKNALVARHGILIYHAESWSGKGSDPFKTAERAFMLCDELKLDEFDYDADGIGASVRGDSRVINERRHGQGLRQIRVTPYRASGAVFDPERQMIEGRKNDDYFENYGSQSAWHLKFMFMRTYRWVVEGQKCNPSDIISIDSKLPELSRLLIELAQPTSTLSKAGKVVIVKTQANTRSPNLFDALRIACAPKRPPMQISDSLLNPGPHNGS